ncbi:MAG: hypothetical protein Q7S28_03735 [bacterium]|nr:hypothetical protein [bacterium]
MNVLPAFNCQDKDCIIAKWAIAKHFLPPHGWVHLDVTDAKFTYNKTWGDAEAWKELAGEYNTEVHLMVEEPGSVVESWLHAGAKRLIVHVETINPATLTHIVEAAKRYNADVFLASNPETPPEKYLPYADVVAGFQVLAVHPGLAGQKFLHATLEKIKRLRIAAPQLPIEVDGGVTEELAHSAKDAGASIAVAATAIFGAENPQKAYETFRAV